MILDYPVFIDPVDNFIMTAFRGTEELWEILTRKNVLTEVVNKAD